ncbi:DUF1958 domain-containing protein [Granulicatella sp. zg-ZJ]|uniref:serine hydrolase n=1 Tax=Granulicatella sp. zg-ZJ TaxID=2678504 RepID=UPI0013D21DBE|nr:serine hydrolase [Granulicatella sp. zg-ZJ]NEW63295.1 DUF1958 domain-containing protein [Granulicatella sp. zg-ZJ]
MSSKKRIFFKLFLVCTCVIYIISSLSITLAHQQISLVDIVKQEGLTSQQVPVSALVVDADTGQILFEENSEKIWETASLAKLMTVYLVLDAMKSGQFTKDTILYATEEDEKISQIYLLSNTTIVKNRAYSIEDLLFMSLMSSSNVATIMLAKAVTNNDISLFIDQMNQKAKKLGMLKTSFTNPTGAITHDFQDFIHTPHYDESMPSQSTAQDLARLCFSLLQEHEEILEYTKYYEVIVNEKTPYAELLTNTNVSLQQGGTFFEGVDGLKTGSSPGAQLNYIQTVKRGNKRLIEVVLGVGKWDNEEDKYARHKIANALASHVYREYEETELLPVGTHTIHNTKIELDKSFSVFVKKDRLGNIYLKENTVVYDAPLGYIGEPIRFPIKQLGFVQEIIEQPLDILFILFVSILVLILVVVIIIKKHL